MIVRRCSIHSDTFQKFVEYKADVVYLMKSCDHGMNINIPNPYHMEGDVWTHTCMSYQSLLHDQRYHVLDDDDKLLVCLAVLCHDLGKPYKKFLSDKNRFRFGGHEARSVIETINLMDMLVNVYRLNSVGILNLLTIVSAHSAYWLRDSMQEVVPLLNYDASLMELYKIVVNADHNGQLLMSSNLKEGEKDINAFEFDFSKQPKVDNDKPFIYVMIGAPASGKDHLIDLYFRDVTKFSQDDLRLRLYEESNVVDNNTPLNEVYNTAWKWCQDRKIDLDGIMYDEMRQAIERGDKLLAISKTHMGIKARSKVINRLRNDFDANIVAIAVLSDVYDLYERDRQRAVKDKSLGNAKIDSFFYRFELPTMAEGFDDIHAIVNLNEN